MWHYRQADPEFGGWKARNLVNELAALAANEPVQVRHGKKIVEVTASSINKGAAILRLLEGKTGSDQLILVAGDDSTDESMFGLSLPNLLTVKVGEGESCRHTVCPIQHNSASFCSARSNKGVYVWMWMAVITERAEVIGPVNSSTSGHSPQSR